MANLTLAVLALLLQAGDAALRAGDSVRAAIDDAQPVVTTTNLSEHFPGAPTVGRAHRVVVTQPGTYAFTLRSLDFDAYLVLRDGHGSVLAEDDNGWYGTQALLVRDLAAGQEFTVEACALHGRHGNYELAMLAAPPAPLSRRERAGLAVADAEARLADAAKPGSNAPRPNDRTLKDLRGALANALLERGRAELDAGDATAARASYERCRELRLEAFGPNSGPVAQADLALGHALSASNELAEAEALFRDAVRIREQTVGLAHEWTIDDRCTLAGLLLKRGDAEGARVVLEEALVNGKPLGDHFQIGRAHSVLGDAQAALGRTAASAAEFETALSLFERIGTWTWLWTTFQRLLPRSARTEALRMRLVHALGEYERQEPDGRVIAEILLELADTRWPGTTDEERVALVERAIAHRARILGPDHPDTLAAVTRLAALQEQRKDFAAALRAQERILESRRRTAPESIGAEWAALDAGRIHRLLGELDASRRLQEQVVAFCESLGDRVTPGHLAPLVESFFQSGDRESALRSLARFLELARATPPAQFEDSLEALAPRLDNIGEQETSLDLWRRLLASREERLGAGDVQLAPLHRSIGQALQTLGRYDEARTSLERTLALREAAKATDPSGLSYALFDLAVLDLTVQRFRSAAEELERAVALLDTVPGRDDETLATLLVVLGIADSALGERERGAAVMERALPLVRASGGREDASSATLLELAAMPLVEMGRYTEAGELAARALALRERDDGAGGASTANALNLLAQAELYQGRQAEARALIERASKALEGSQGAVVSLLTPILVNNMGQLLLEQGLVDEAERYLTRAVPMLEARFGVGHAMTALACNNLGLVLCRAGRYAEARPRFERAVETFQAVYGPEHPNTALGMTNLAYCLRMLGELDRAADLVTRAIAVWERAGTPTHPRYGRALQNAAAIRRAQKRWPEARDDLDRARAFLRSVLPEGHPWLLDVENESVRLDLDQGRDAAAASSALEALRISSERADRLLWSLTEHERLEAAARLRDSLELLLSARADGLAESERYAAVLAWKGRASRSLVASRHEALRTLGGKDRGLVADLAAVQSELSRAVFAPETADRAARDQHLEELRVRRADLEARLVRASGRTASSAVDVAALRAALPPGTVVVDFLVHRVYERGSEANPDGWAPTEHLSAWILRAGGEGVSRVDFGPVPPLRDAVAGYLASLVAERGVARETAMGPGADPAGERLRSLLWDPIEPLLGAARIVLVSPDTFLATLPFEVVPRGQDRYLVEERAFVYLEDATALACLPAAKRAEHPSLLAVGGLDYRHRDDLAWRTGAPTVTSGDDDDGERLAASAALRGSFTDHWSRLPATGVEAQTVAELHAEAFGEKTPRLVLEGASATEERLAAELPTHSVVHLATHGFFQPEGLTSMWEEVRGERGVELAMREPERRVLGMLPGLLSGIVCSGANCAPEKDRDDGYLTAEELGWLDLSGVDLAVLSACETGLGSPSAGEGLLGLRRSLRQAGVDTVISSLWSVRDEATGELMRDFYTGLWLRGEGRLQALRNAQLALLKRNRIRDGRALPSTWGAFVLSGDWR